MRTRQLVLGPPSELRLARRLEGSSAGLPGVLPTSALLDAAQQVPLIAAAAARTLRALDAAGAPAALLCGEVERAGDALVALVRDAFDDDASPTVLGWRDVLACHVHAARALDDVGVHRALQVDLLFRGLRDVATAARACLADPPDRRAGESVTAGSSGSSRQLVPR